MNRARRKGVVLRKRRARAKIDPAHQLGRSRADCREDQDYYNDNRSSCQGVSRLPDEAISLLNDQVLLRIVDGAY